MRFVPLDIATKLMVSLGIGLLVGFEREWSHKDLGVRTFAIVSLLGMLCALESETFAWVGLVAVVLVATTMNVGNLLLRRDVETTTSVALIVVFTLGVLVGGGHIFTPTAAAVLMTLLLGLKPQFTRFAGGVTAEELRGAVLLGLIGFVIYPLLPNRLVDPWGLVNPREAWLTVILIAGLGFVNYVLLRVYSTRGIYYTAVFGGLVNSTAAVAELSNSIEDKRPGGGGVVVTAVMIAVLAMFVRNLALVTVFSRPAGWIALWPIAAMCVFVAVIVTVRGRTGAVEAAVPRASSPISIRKVLSFGLFFVAIEALSTLGQRWLGEAGSVGASLLGGLVSSASATAAVGSLAAHGQIAAHTAGASTVLTSIASAAINLPILYRTTRGGTFRQLIGLSGVTIAIGLGVLAAILFWGPRE